MFLNTVIKYCLFSFLFFSFFGDVDVLQKLGLSSQRLGTSSSSDIRAVPNGVIPVRSGVILTPGARLQAPLRTVIPASYTSTNLSLIFSLLLHRINSAFLFSVLSKRGKLQLGVQFVPGKVLVHVGHRSSVSFDYDIHDGRRHNLALGVQGQEIFFRPSCWGKITHKSLQSNRAEALDADGSFLLGKMNHNSVSFEGAICQFDIYPSAKAAHNYCDYIKKHCREADTYRAALPPLLPLFSTGPNITVTYVTPQSIMETSNHAQRRTPARTGIPVPAYDLLMLNKTSVYHRVSTARPGAVYVSPRVQPQLESPFALLTAAVTTTLGIHRTPPNQKPALHDAARKNTGPEDTDSFKPYAESLDIPAVAGANLPTTTAFTQASPLTHQRLLTTTSGKKPEPNLINIQDVAPTSITPITGVATDGFQAFDLEPTTFSLLTGSSGLKGEPGPPVSLHPSGLGWYIGDIHLFLPLRMRILAENLLRNAMK